MFGHDCLGAFAASRLHRHSERSEESYPLQNWAGHYWLRSFASLDDGKTGEHFTVADRGRYTGCGLKTTAAEPARVSVYV